MNETHFLRGVGFFVHARRPVDTGRHYSARPAFEDEAPSGPMGVWGQSPQGRRPVQTVPLTPPPAPGTQKPGPVPAGPLEGAYGGFGQA